MTTSVMIGVHAGRKALVKTSAKKPAKGDVVLEQGQFFTLNINGEQIITVQEIVPSVDPSPSASLEK